VESQRRAAQAWDRRPLQAKSIVPVKDQIGEIVLGP
jgi:hypothetical protein